MRRGRAFVSSDSQFGRETGPAQIEGQVAHVVGDEYGRRPVWRVAEHRERGIALIETHLAPFGGVQRRAKQPADEEVMRDDQFVPCAVVRWSGEMF